MDDVHNKKPKKNKKPSLIVEAFNFKNIAVKKEIYSSLKIFSWKVSIKNLLLLFVGAFLTTTSFFFLIIPTELYTNGLSAFAQLIVKFIFSNDDSAEALAKQAFWTYIVLMGMNTPIIIWGLFKVGLRFTMYTIFYMIFQIAIIEIIGLFPYLKDFKFLGVKVSTNEDSNFILARTFIFAALAGLIYGIGIGLLFKTGGSSGGMDFISTYISMKRKYSIASIIRNTNILIVVLVLIIDGHFLKGIDFIDNIFGRPHFIATIVYIYVSAFIMNRVYPKYMLMTVFIISNELDQIRNDIYRNNYLRGGNVWNVKGLYSGNNYKMMMTTMSLLEYNFFKSKITQIDCKVFMVILPTKYMHGGSTGKPVNEFLEKN